MATTLTCPSIYEAIFKPLQALQNKARHLQGLTTITPHLGNLLQTTEAFPKRLNTLQTWAQL